jgi:chitinase
MNHEQRDPATNEHPPAARPKDVLATQVTPWTVPPGGFSPEQPRRLSIVRVAAALGIVGAAVAGGLAVVRSSESNAVGVAEAWYAPYVDVTLTPQFAFEDPLVNPASDIVLSFVVADGSNACEPSWGSAYTLDETESVLDLDRRLALYRQNGGDVVISFGGATNDELATACDDPGALLAAYRDVVERYDATTIDLDIEGDDLSDTAASQRRADAVAALQQERQEAGGDLAVWLTLPVTPSGLTAEAVSVVDATLAAGVDLAGVNIMTMNFGDGRATGDTMADATVDAVAATNRQLISAYQRIDERLSYEQVQRKIGVTPMIGQNDDADDVFALADADAVTDLVKDSGLGRLSMWSLNRDAPCGPNVPASAAVSNFCTGLDQDPFEFSSIFHEIAGRPAGSADVITTPLTGEPVADDPATAPYPIWDGDHGYEQDDKVVWHGYVYVAKWYNTDESPDAPIVSAWETPWTLIGPVLATDTPVAPVPTVADGTYPAWDGTATYQEGDRVVFRNYAYEAKWWTQGNQPGIDVPDQGGTAWKLIDPTADDAASAGS